ncbi:unnamed protein product [Prorocentrum cordatum]|uniref:Uncharacterized protein n=1 Tax=Prorocentrum cordatum TaxID=2364126 RepID=A0ABN9X2D4_9DINO|nr:unnamed protein product [Polarella glacialis]
MVTGVLPRGEIEPFLELTDDIGANENPLVHYIDFITGHRDPVPPELDEQYKAAWKDDSYHNLPPPFGFKTAPQHHMTLQICILDAPDGTKTIIKHCVIPNKAKTAVFASMAFGSVKKLCFQHPKVGVKVWQYAFERFGGKQCRAFFLSPDVKTATKVNEFYELSDEDINAGFEYILKNAPRSTAELKQLVWQTKALRKGAPLYGWPVPLVAKALSGLAAEGALAKKEFENNVILCEDHFNLRVLEAMQELINSNDSLVLIGEPNIGKTPLGRAFLMAMCRRNARVHGLDPAGCCIRVTPEIDFLRGEPGDILMGDFVDDGCLNLLPPKMVKALLDVGQYESMCWARWGATKWKKGEPRCLADQTYDPNAEKLGRWPSVKFQEFFELVRPAFSEKATRACMLAFFKRSAFLVNTQEYLYWRPAGTEEKDVPRINFKGETFLTAEGKRLYLLQKDGDMTPPANIQQLLEKERLLVDSAVEKNRKKSSDAALGSLPAPSFVQVKRERVSPERLTFRKRLLSGMTLNVDSPSPAKQHAAASSTASGPAAPPRDDLEVQLSQMLAEEGAPAVPAMPSAAEEDEVRRAGFAGSDGTLSSGADAARAAEARGRSRTRGQRFPQKRRNKRSVQAASRRRDILAKARKARKAAQAKRKRLEATGVFYTPKRQRVSRVRRGRSSLAKIYTYEDLRALKTKDAYDLMVQAGYLGDPSENVCPRCGWPLGSVIHRGEKRHPVQRCQRKACSSSSVQVKVTSGTWADVEVPLPKLAGVAFLSCGALTSRMSTADMALIAKMGHKQCEAVRQSLLEIVSAASREEQKSIVLSGQCETDATTLRVVQLKNGRNMHIRVFGMCKRGDHEHAVVHMLPPFYAVRGGPTRPESTDETAPLISAHTGADVLIWHTDGARCYRRLENHTKVKHAKRIWATVKTLTLSGGDVLCCYGGTQLQDGLWSHVKNVVPTTMNTYSKESQAQLENWVHFWAWRYRRASCPDMFLELGSAVAMARLKGHVW